MRSLFLLVPDLGEAEELAQEAMARVFERWDRVRIMESPGGYVYRTAVNLNRRRLRHLAVRARKLLTLGAGTDAAASPETGRELAEAIESAPPDAAWPVAAVNGYLVFQVAQADDTHLVVWDPTTGSIVDRLHGAFPLAWQGYRLAWCQDDDCKAVHITDFSSSDEMVVVCPVGTFGFDAYEGAFSPDGKTLALALRLDFGADSRRALAMIDVEEGTMDVVDGTNVEQGHVFVDWSPSGESVFITGGARFGPRQLVEYRVDDGTARTIPVEVGDFYGMAAF